MARLEQQHAPAGRYITRRIVVSEADPQCEAYIAAEYDRLERDHAPLTPQDHVLLIARIVIERIPPAA